MDLNKERKRLNWALKAVVRGGHSPSQALEYLYLMWGSLLGECADDGEIIEWTAKMISRCAEWQAAVLTPDAVARALMEEAEEIKQYHSVVVVKKRAEEQEDE